VREVEEESSETREVEETSGVETEVNNTSQDLSVTVVTSSNQSGRSSSSSNMANQDLTLRLPAFHGMGRDDAEQHWFTCEAIWSMK
jgi:hypothetical protein